MATTNAYCTLAQLKAALRLTDSDNDTILENCIDAAARLIDGHAMRHFFSAGTATRVFVPDTDIVCYTNDLAGTAITLKTTDAADTVYETTWTTADYQLEPINGLNLGQAWPYTRIRSTGTLAFPRIGEIATVQITGVWGWAAIPPQIVQANVLQSSRLFKRYDSPLGVAGFGELGAIRVSKGLDTDVAQLVDPFRLGSL